MATYARTPFVQDNASLEHLLLILVGRLYLMWKDDEIVTWLKNTVDCAIDI